MKILGVCKANKGRWLAVQEQEGEKHLIVVNRRGSFLYFYDKGHMTTMSRIEKIEECYLEWEARQMRMK